MALVRSAVACILTPHCTVKFHIQNILHVLTFRLAIKTRLLSTNAIRAIMASRKKIRPCDSDEDSVESHEEVSDGDEGEDEEVRFSQPGSIKRLKFVNFMQVYFHFNDFSASIFLGYW